MATPGGGTRRAVLTSLAVAAAALLLFVGICTIPAERVESLLRSNAQVRPLSLYAGSIAPTEEAGLLQALSLLMLGQHDCTWTLLLQECMRPR